MFSKLRLVFNKYHFSFEEQEVVLSHFETQTLQKKSFFLKAGEVVDKIAFVEEGAFHYYISNDGEEITTFIMSDYNMITSISSYLQNAPSTENIQAITDSTIAVISKDSVNKLKKEIPQFQNLYTDIIESQIICLDKNRTDLLTLTPEQRYVQILQKQPQLFSKIPLKLLASTLGISPRHLTRIRRNIIN